MNACSKYSHKKYFHETNCGYLWRIKKANRIWFDNREKARDAGLTACPWCSKMGRQYRMEKSDIEGYVKGKELKVRYYDNALEIQTEMAHWKIEYSKKGKLNLLHESHQIYRLRPIVKGGYDIKYHHQRDIKSDTLLGFIRYIDNHDRWRETLEKPDRNSFYGIRGGKKKYKEAKKKVKNKAVRRVLNRIEELSLQKGGKKYAGR